MKVLVINGSPKSENSNTMYMTRAFLRGAGWEDAETVDVSKTNIESCLGCFACWSVTPGECVISDGMGEILEKIVAADVLVWSFPLYYFGVPGALKNLIDRQLPLSLPFMLADAGSGGHPSRYDMSHQKHIIISTCGFWTAEGNYDAVMAMFDHFCGPDKYDAILCGQGELFKIPELRSRTDAYLDVVRRAGAECAAGDISSDTKEELKAPLYPREVFEKMADASWGVSQEKEAPVAVDGSLSFTRQMAALYVPDGLERVLEFHYTDIDKRYQILLTKQGSEVITENFKPYTTKIKTPYTLWRSISRNEISGQDALFQHLYSVQGDFNLMIKWDDLFGPASTTLNKSAAGPTPTTSNKSGKGSAPMTSNKSGTGPTQKPNMTIFLLPWIVIWIALAIDPIIGGAVTIGVAALLPLLWLFYRPVIFEQVSIPVVISISLASLFGADTQLLIPASYLLFGLMWISSLFLKIPLTAHYSASAYGAEKAMTNPLFISTNRILTAAWGVLYLVTPIWTYFLMGTKLSPYIGLINSVLPALMGLFTAWFQRWYPANYAKG